MKKEHISIRAVILWLVIWEIGALLLNKEVFLVSPVRTVMRLGQLAVTAGFWFPVVGSLMRIVSGYILALAAALVLSRIAFIRPGVRSLLAPLIAAIKAVPVASFVILALICFSSKYLAVFLAFLIVTPLVYANALAGYDSQSIELAEMADVFRINKWRKFRYIEIPQIQSHVMSAAKTGIGMAWKAGIAAEVIGTPDASIGQKLYQAKVYLETPDLLAWTAVVIILSVATEGLFIFMLGKLFKGLKSVPSNRGVTKRHVQVTDRQSVVDRQQSIADRQSAAGSSDITFDRVTKSFGGTRVLKKYSRTFSAGKTSVIMAPSGSGKTTILRMIAGLEKPDSGSVGAPDRVAMVFQEDRLLDYLTAYGNIKVAVPNASADDIRNHLTEMGIPEEELDKPVGCWSGGMKRRAALLRALTADGVLLLDEPFKGLDQEAKDMTIRVTGAMANKRTLILVTHDKDEEERIKQ